MSTTSTTLTSILSALGGSSGIDVSSAVSAILYADRAPERIWQSQQATLSSQTTAIQQIESEASSLNDALTSIQSATGSLSSVSATSSNTNLLTATASNGTAASSHLITINNLAATASWYSASVASGSTPLTDGTSFNITAGGVTTTINVASGNDTLSELAASINSQSLGVTANVITDSSGARLSLVSTASGAAGDISVSNGSSSLGFTRAATGTDASITVDGVPITSATNTVTGAISGVSLNLTGTTGGSEITLQIAPNNSSITSAVSSFVSAYNTLISDVNSQFAYSSTSGVAGTLQTDSTVQALQSALLNSTNFNSTGGGAFATLSALGISTNADGTLSLNTSTLNDAITSNNTAVASFFQGSTGFAASLISTLNTYTDTTSGAFTVDLKSIKSEYNDLTDQTNTLEAYLSTQQTVLTTQYNNINVALQQLPQKLKQINAILNPNSTSSSS